MPWLPKTLDQQPKIVWTIDLPREGLGGIAANEEVIVFGDRDFDDLNDCFRCYDAKTGQPLWEVQRLAIASFDYGNSPRATPLIHGDLVYCLGATGNLVCINIESGDVVWERAYRDDFPIDQELPWGYCGSPLLVDGKLIVTPGSEQASIVALDPETGEIVWKTPGDLPSYGSLNVGTFNGVFQIVGHDHTTLGGWRVADGKRIWSIKPEADGDFNVPTPLVYQQNLIVCTGANSTRMFDFSGKGVANNALVAQNRQLRPDMTTPVVVGDKLFCVREFLYCLDLSDGLREAWRIRDKALSDYASLFISEDRLMVVADGELLLLPADGTKQILSRMRIFDLRQPIYSHPALVGNRLYVRGKAELLCIEL